MSLVKNIRNAYLKIDKKEIGTKFIIAYIIFTATTTVRFFSENCFTGFGSDKYDLIFHHHYWYVFVISMFLINFRYVLKIHPNKLWWISFCAPVILIPIVANLVITGGADLEINYISAKEPRYLLGILTFQLFSNINKPISFELIIITLSIAIFSYTISKKVFLSIFTAITCYLSLMMLAGTVIFAPHYPEYALIFIKTSFSTQKTFALIYFGAALISITILFLKEILIFLKPKQNHTLFFFSFSILFVFIQMFFTNLFIPDRILLIFHPILYAFLITTLKFNKDKSIKKFVTVFSVLSFGILIRLLFY